MNAWFPKLQLLKQLEWAGGKNNGETQFFLSPPDSVDLLVLHPCPYPSVSQLAVKLCAYIKQFSSLWISQLYYSTELSAAVWVQHCFVIGILKHVCYLLDIFFMFDKHLKITQDISIWNT